MVFKDVSKIIMKKLHQIFVIGIIIFSLSFCESKHKPDESLQSTLWLRASAEYRAATEQAFRVAREILPIAQNDSTWTAAIEQIGDFASLPPAIILDIDQTLLDNSPFQAKMIKSKIDFDAKQWDEWLQDANIPAVAGALEFVKLARRQGIQIFYVTNRLFKFKSATKKNLEKSGFPIDSSMDVILTQNQRKNWGEDKTSRRTFIADRFRVLLIIGDDLNDFVSAHVSVEERFELVNQYRDYWGRKWILLPNPLYGSWEMALFNYQMELSASEKRELKYKYLRTRD